MEVEDTAAAVQQLLDELLDSNATPEMVCGSCPELLSTVRDRWRQMRRVRADLDALFPPPDEPMPRPPAGTTLPHIPGYDVEAVLGRGGMGVVFRARHLRLNRPVALKMAHADVYSDRREQARFQREAEAVAGLRHPNIVQIHDVGDADGRPYFTMELMDGGSLAQKLRGTPQPAHEAAESLARAMHVAHQGGIVHRDLKPSNVLLAADGTPKIADFGLARRLESGAGLTQRGVPVGTPSYMAPEQAQGQKHAVGPAVDVYALGAILYELLTGRPPFRGETAACTMQQVIAQDPVPPSRLNLKVPRDLETICLRCLRKAPQHRYVTALELAEDLGRYQRSEPIVARPVSRSERVARWVRRKPTAAALIVTALALTGLAITSGVSKWRLEAARRAETARWAPRLEVVKQLQMTGRFQEARAVLQRLPNADVGDLNDQIRGALAELDLAQNLDRIRHNRAAVVDGRFDLDSNRTRSDREYEATFGEAGIGGFHDARSVAAARVRGSHIRTALVAALDDWALCTNDESRRSWIFAVARGADPDPGGWRDRVRAPVLSQKDLTELADAALVQDQSVQVLVALAQRMQAAGADAIAFLGRVQQQYAGDFWASFTLADALWGKKPAECIRYYQAALAIRPETVLAHHNVGRALANAGRIEEAIAEIETAIQLDAQMLYAHSLLGDCWRQKQSPQKALIEYNKAIELRPNDAYSIQARRAVMVQLGLGDAVRAEWGHALKANPPGHAAWYGYAEMCLYLGHEDEYKRACHELLARFESSTDPRVCEQTGRACLLGIVGPEMTTRAAAALVERAVQACTPAWAIPYFSIAQGLARYRLGDFDSAVRAIHGDALRVHGPLPHLVLSMAHRRAGRTDEALRSFATAIRDYDWSPSRVDSHDAWLYHTLRREAEPLVMPNLAALLTGKVKPRDHDERMALIAICQSMQRTAMAARLFVEVFDTDPEMANRLEARHRYYAACCAARAGCGDGEDMAPLSDEERALWRERARGWLRDDLIALRALLTSASTERRAALPGTLESWLKDRALACVRDDGQLGKLSPAEREAWLAFWRDAKALLAEAKSAISKTPQ